MAKVKQMQIENPFSDEFLETWGKWKEYKKAVHGFVYKGVMSEQVKLMQLHEMAKGDEETAKEIILRSIGEQWSGLFPLPDNYYKNKNNGAKPIGNADLRQSVADELKSRSYTSRGH